METRGARNTHVAVVDSGRHPAGSRVSARHRVRPVLEVALGIVPRVSVQKLFL